ncbi:MAG: putative toxin-antitoxin system toxin component, PIN family [Burkholderiales bacterium]|nr:putative toxin-antitoxin system toxin component, PIN family [Burkholderiales bacterium]
MLQGLLSNDHSPAPAAAQEQRLAPSAADGIGPDAPAAVIDTNVVLDLFLFRDTRADWLRRALAAGQLRWLATPAMRDELEQVLGRALLQAWRPDAQALLRRVDEQMTPVAPAPATPLLRCRDGADQMFVDLALAGRARWLISRDRDVLALRRRALALGLAIGTPEQLAPEG